MLLFDYRITEILLPALRLSSNVYSFVDHYLALSIQMLLSILCIILQPLKTVKATSHKIITK